MMARCFMEEDPAINTLTAFAVAVPFTASLLATVISALPTRRLFHAESEPVAHENIFACADLSLFV